MVKTKYPNVYKDSSGSFYYLVELGHDLLTGKRIQKKSRKDSNNVKFRSAHDAYKEALRVKNDYQESHGYTNYNIEYEAFMDKYYIPSYKSDVESSTYKTRISPFRHLKKWFGTKKLRSIKPIDCEQFRTYLLNNSDYSQGFASMIYCLFRNSLDYAVRMSFLDSNPSRKTKAINKGKSHVEFWTKDDFEKVLSVIYTKDYYQHMCFVILYLYFTCGMRVSEGLALTYDDVDFKKRQLKIHKTLEMKNKHDYQLKPYTKTINGIRTISLDKDTVKLLKDWRKDQQKHGVYNFIMSYDDTPMSRTTIPLIVKRFAKIAGVKPIQAKGLRHSNVSYLINEFNADVLTVSRRLGHSGPDITLKYYSHLWPRNDKSIADDMEGNIKFTPARKNRLKFTGNQNIRSTK
ncbi:tyrosine-type recombinase/integrase [Limosilactobacillus agrestis]|uniref:tyrosine-type recombinase/integrase n=1 Tax=Limosilactobacillus agrestis TaxID=2759748 RepID=UPI0039E177C9